MTEVSSRRRKAPVVLILLLIMLTIVTLSVAGGLAYGFSTGLLMPYWEQLTDAHAAIFSQLIFFLAAAWASLLVPLLFREQLSTLEDAANDAKRTFADIKAQMEKTAADSEKQFENIVRLQMMSVGHLLDEQIQYLNTPEDKKLFVDTRWDKARTKVDAAIAMIHGNKQNSIHSNQYRSAAWWQRVQAYDVLGEFHDDFRLISDKKNKQNLELSDLHAVNEAARHIENFVPSPPASIQVPFKQPSPTPSPPPSFTPPNGEGEGPASPLQ